MNNKLCENLTLLMEHYHVGAVQLARLTGIPLSTIKNIRKGANVNPTIETLVPLARHFATSLEDLIQGDPLVQKMNPLLPTKQAASSPRSVPVISWEVAKLYPQSYSSFSN